jgi:hypothetical protein
MPISTTLEANASLQPLQEKQKVEEEEGAALPWVG